MHNRGKRRLKVSPVVQSSDPVHQSSPVITDSQDLCPQIFLVLRYHACIFTMEILWQWKFPNLWSKVKKVHKHVHTLFVTILFWVTITKIACIPFLPLSDSSLTLSNLAVVLETVEVERLGICLSVPDSVQEKLEQQCDNDEERRNELISWWLQYSPCALDSWKCFSSQLLYSGEESPLAAVKRYIHQTPGMSVVNYRHAPIHSVMCIVNVVWLWKGHNKPSPYWEESSASMHVCIACFL